MNTLTSTLGLAAVAASASSAVTPVPTSTFLDSIGIVTTFPDRGKPIKKTIEMVKYCGFRWVRGGIEGVKGGGHGSTTWVPLAKLQRDFYAAVKADPLLRKIPVWSPSEMGAEPDNVGLQFLVIPEGADTVMPAGTRYVDFLSASRRLPTRFRTARRRRTTCFSATPPASTSSLFGPSACPAVTTSRSYLNGP